MRDERTMAVHLDGTWIHFFVALKDVIQDHGALCFGEQQALEPDHASGWDVVFQMKVVVSRQFHVPQDASPRAHFFNNRSLILDGTPYHKLFVRLQRDPVLFPENHLWLRDLWLIAFSPHLLDENGQVQLV